ncbi:MAG: RNA polymerase sigma factor [Chloroflexota bacterium]
MSDVAGLDCLTQDLQASNVDGAGRDLSSHVEQRLLSERPRLLRLAQSVGVSPDAADDVVQDTLLAAWRRFEGLRSPDRFDAWLDAICRNQSHMYLRTQYRRTSKQALPLAENREPVTVGDTIDPLALDPLEELTRQDLEVLVDRALGHISPAARAVLDLRYLQEMTEREVAASLGVSVVVLEGRLHRARRQLRAVLDGPLCAEAEAFGLTHPEQPAWQHTRVWCNRCGQRRLVGLFENLDGGRTELRMRCPDCSPRYGADIYRSKGIASLDGLRSFRPALTRRMRALADRTSETLATGHDVCLHCGSHVHRRVAGPSELPAELAGLASKQHWVIGRCRQAQCSRLGPWPAVEPAIWFHPEAQSFMTDHPRWIVTPEEVVERDGSPALRFRLLDASGPSQLLLLADPETLQIRETFKD